MLKNRKGFTIIEMLIVIGIIALLLLLIIPNINEKQKMINEKGCDALKETINSQVYLYELKFDKMPETIQDLVDEGFIKEEQTRCKNGNEISLEDNEAVSE